MIFLVIVLLLILVPLIAIHYRRLINRVIFLANDINWIEKKPETKRRYYGIWIISAVLGILSFNMFSIAGIYLLHFLVISLIFELINLIIKRALKWDKKIWTRVFYSSVIPLICSGVILGYGYANIRNIVRTSYSVQAQKNISRDYKVLFISDIRYGTILEKEGLEELVKRLNREKGDIVILGGDITDESTEKVELQELFSKLGNISSKYGIYFVWGNHDRQTYSGNPKYTQAELSKAITENGIKILEDEVVTINNEIALIGRNDYGALKFSEEKRAKISEILKNEDNEKFIITADHQPVDYEEIKEQTDLVVSGHTHAGQVFPAGYFIKLIKTADLWYGHEKVGNMDAVVSSGASGWGYPIRTQKHSEYVVIEIKR